MNECINHSLREILHGYEMNRLNEADRERFEAHLLECAFCLTEAESMRRLTNALLANRSAMLAALREDGLTFDQIRRRLLAPRESLLDKLAASLRTVFGRVALAGALATAVLFTFLLWPRTGDSPYRQYLSYDLPPYQTGLELRGEIHNEAATVFEAAMESYRRGNYRAAIDGIRKSLELDSNQPDRWLYLGVSQYAAHDARAAIRSLRKADEDGQGLTKLRARWYLAQSYLYLSKPTPAEALLEWIVAQNGEHAEDAERLLTLINVK